LLTRLTRGSQRIIPLHFKSTALSPVAGASRFYNLSQFRNAAEGQVTLTMPYSGIARHASCHIQTGVNSFDDVTDFIFRCAGTDCITVTFAALADGLVTVSDQTGAVPEGAFAFEVDATASGGGTLADFIFIVFLEV